MNWYFVAEIALGVFGGLAAFDIYNMVKAGMGNRKGE